MTIKTKQKIMFALVRASNWAPKPYVAFSGSDGDEPLSWWFYKPACKGCSSYQRNWIGNSWKDFWFFWIKKLMKM